MSLSCCHQESQTAVYMSLRYISLYMYKWKYTTHPCCFVKQKHTTKVLSTWDLNLLFPSGWSAVHLSIKSMPVAHPHANGNTQIKNTKHCKTLQTIPRICFHQLSQDRAFIAVQMIWQISWDSHPNINGNMQPTSTVCEPEKLYIDCIYNNPELVIYSRWNASIRWNKENTNMKTTPSGGRNNTSMPLSENILMA